MKTTYRRNTKNLRRVLFRIIKLPKKSSQLSMPWSHAIKMLNENKNHLFNYFNVKTFKFSLINVNCFTLLSFRRFRLSVTVYPAAENVRLTETLLAGVHSTFFAVSAITAKDFSCVCKNFSGSLSRGITFT